LVVTAEVVRGAVSAAAHPAWEVVGAALVAVVVAVAAAVDGDSRLNKEH
jgi:hypothetical protein